MPNKTQFPQILSRLRELPSRLKTCLVTGGDSGFLGTHLVQALSSSGCDVRYLKGDIRDVKSVKEQCQGVDTVFHTAAVILVSGVMRQSQRDHVHSVNVDGTQNLIDACVETGISRLIYTSSNNVVFDREVIDGDESLPYASKLVDVYTETKILAEQAILRANDRHGLCTCALRPGGIYGPGDHIMLPRIAESLKAGQLLFTIGPKDAVGDIVYIDNLVDAHLLAAAELTKDSPIAGQSYFISDGTPCNYFEFMRPFVESAGYPFPKLAIPASLAYPVGFLAEVGFWLLGREKPFLSRMEVKKVSLTNTFSTRRANQDFGYSPRVPQHVGFARSIPYFRELFDKIETVQKPHPGWWCSVLAGMTTLGILAFNPDAYALFTTYVTDIFSQPFLQGLFGVSAALHAGEALYAWRIAKKRAWGWSLQTLLLGYPSLRLLLAKRKQSVSHD